MPEPAGPSPRVPARTKARKAALDVLFAADLRGLSPLDALEQAVESPVRDYTAALVRGVAENLDDLDSRIASRLPDGWTVPRMPRVDRCLARMAVWEFVHGGVPAQVAIEQAVGLASALSTDESPGFLNGILGALIAER